ncbi:MAG: His/Gly/Thr/Pro-type tRNA ligase C-terminal domain-containing protein [Candidatus Micrarchaeota archaeon]|nr:His/Gly/Thr/Pro-type tRNA ligase C-terminal domain-containing protein [Candidatus Micrarchaeota archaeon]
MPFIFFERPQWDKFPGAEKTYAADSMMPDGKVLQLPSTHLLGQNFAKPFDVKFLNEKGEYEYCYQTCYGPAISRIYAAIISAHGDDGGLVMPFALAPVQVMVVPIPKKGNEEMVIAKAKSIAAMLCGAGMRAEVDASDSTPGYKYNWWEMKGVPFRVEVGAREAESGIFPVARRDNKVKSQIKESELSTFILAESVKMFSDMKKKAQDAFDATLSSADTMAVLASGLEKGKLVATPFCSMEMDGEKCAESVKEKTGGNVRGTRFDKSEKPHGNCIVCGKTATAIVYIARQY